MSADPKMLRVRMAAECVQHVASRTPAFHNGAAVDLGRVRRFSASTGEIDTFDTILNPDGWVGLAEYAQSGSVFWHHPEENSEGGTRDMLPIGRPLRVWSDGAFLRAEIEFASPDLNPFADVVLRMLDAGFISGISPGFIPQKAPEPIGGGVVYLPENLLVELSITPLRANPGALMQRGAEGAGDAGEVLAGWLSRAISDPSLARGFGREILTRALGVLKGEQMSAEEKPEKTTEEEGEDANVLDVLVDIRTRMAEIESRLPGKKEEDSEPAEDAEGQTAGVEDDDAENLIEIADEDGEIEIME